ncbi:alanine--tRNA ligase [Candidatus Dojkabacteria bacterium]|nr:alanine--tRNA ligase [Candidatus Dojkabacteria bacterium]
MKTSEQLREEFKTFWESSPRNAKEIPNVSLVPNNDPTLLYVNSGMFPINPYLSGQPHPLGTRLFNFQRCLRTKYEDMIEIGDNRHTLMFEMMGNWSLGDFTKTKQIPWLLEFYVEHAGLDPNRIYVTVWEGDDEIPFDQEAVDTWKQAFAKYNVNAEFSNDIHNLPENLEAGQDWGYRIFSYGKKTNWWQRAESTPGELGGPTSEIFYDTGTVEREQDNYDINDDSGRFIEIGNSVFMEYKYGDDDQWHPLDQKNIDFGGGFERLTMCVQNKDDIFETDLYQPITEKISELSGKSYKTNGKVTEDTRYFRILADHSRAAAFILGDGVIPSNKDQGYILRKFIRRLVRFGLKLEIDGNFTKELAEAVIEKMKEPYPNLEKNRDRILDEIDKEETKFKKMLTKGLKEIEKLIEAGVKIDGEKAFYVYETYGFPLEMTLDEFEVSEEAAEEIEKDFYKAQEKHRQKSRADLKKFKGGLADKSEATIKLHTSQHLLLKALQIVLGSDIKQKGSNITAERLRLDFNFNRKLTPEEVKSVEKIVNNQIEKDLEVLRIDLPKEKAEKIGAEMEFGQKYPDTVSVYIVGLKDGVEPENATPDDYFSAEFCGGPHVERTGIIGKGSAKFEIYKQENIGAGVRRIKCRLQD